MDLLKVLVVEDNPHFTRFLIALLEESASYQIVGQANDGLDGIRKAEDLQPDLILLDLGLPKMNGMEVLRRVRKLSPHSKVLIISQDSSPELVDAALSLGASGYLAKSDADEIPQAVEAVLQNKQFVSFRRRG